LKHAVSYGGGNGEEATGLVANNNGDVYNIGWIQGVSTFGSTTLNSAGDRDIYIARTTMEDLTATENPFIDESNISIFPNPSNGRFNLTIDGFEAETLNISIMDVTGRILHSETLDISGQSVYQNQFDIANRTTTGLYFVRIASAEKVITKKIFIR